MARPWFLPDTFPHSRAMALASTVDTNERCLLHSFEQARALLENGTFGNSEPGPYRIFAVYSVDWPAG